MATKEFTYSDVSEHTTKKDLYIVVHDKVYDASSFVDEHPYVAFTLPIIPSPAPLGVGLCVTSGHIHNKRTYGLTRFPAAAKKCSSMSAAKTAQKPSKTSATRTKHARY
jgi:hypothetical protein